MRAPRSRPWTTYRASPRPGRGADAVRRQRVAQDEHGIQPGAQGEQGRHDGERQESRSPKSVTPGAESDDALEDFHWLAREIVAEGGEAVICDAAFLDGITDREVEALFSGANATGAGAPPRPAGRQPLRGRTWVTRQGIKVDRIASAWLIRRFLDPDARFKFVPARGYRPEPGELRFDMFEAEYTHDGDACTFETLLARFGLRDKALRHVAEIVHDLDMKDDKFARDEAPGLASMIDGIARARPADADRLERGAALFDDLYAAFHKPRRSAGP